MKPTANVEALSSMQPNDRLLENDVDMENGLELRHVTGNTGETQTKTASVFSRNFESSRVQSLATTNAIPVQEAKTPVKLRTVSLSGAKLPGNKKKFFKGNCAIGLLVALSFVLVLALGILLKQEKDKQVGDNVSDDDIIVEDVGDFFCGSEEEDQRLRELIGASIAFGQNGDPEIENVFIPCMPDNIALEFSDEILDFVNSAEFLVFNARRLGLQKISPRAFDTGNFSSLIRLDLSRNSLSSFEDGTFSKLNDLALLILDNNAFTELENDDLFSTNDALTIIDLQSNNFFGIPTAPFSAPNLVSFSLSQCFSLIDFNDIDIAALNPSESLTSLSLRGTAILNVNNEVDVREALNALDRNIDFGFL